jgi:hypothetical protein
MEARQFAEDAAAVGSFQSDQMALILAAWYGCARRPCRAGVVVLAGERQAEEIAHGSGAAAICGRPAQRAGPGQPLR